MASPQPVQKIAILGGGVGSLATAFALTSQRGWQKRYEITVYQMGWRLGGKGASGRNQDPDKGQRIEEHGFHVWMGFYDNAFKIIKQCYAELARTRGPFRTWKDAFKKHSFVVIEEQHDGRRKRWQIEFPTGPREPGTLLQLGLLGYAGRMFRLLSKRLPPSHLPQTRARPFARVWQRVWRPVFVVILLLLVLGDHCLRLLDRWLERCLENARSPGAAVRAVFDPLRRSLGWISQTLRVAVELISKTIAAWARAGDISDPDDARRLVIFFDLALAILRGIIVDDIMTKGFHSIDHLEFKEWLRKHHAAPESVDSAIIDAIYMGNFCFTGGDPSKPNFAAGVALHCYLRIFLDYKGALLYKMQAGMGDVVVAPLYLVLRKRGVRFKFFHKVERLAYDHRNNRIAQIEMTEQVALANSEYDPLITVEVDGGEIACWPSTPRYELIRDGEELKQSGINLESQWTKPWKGGTTRQLTHGIDYDLVVLGISIGALGTICKELIDRRPEWRNMIEKVDTVATQAMQLWLSPDLSALGWRLRSPLLVNYENPAPNWLDASQLIPNESLPAQAIGSVAYFCAALKDPASIPAAGPNTFPEDQRRAVQQAHERWLRQHVGYLWPEMMSGSQPPDVTWEMLYDPQNRTGAARLDWQYFRANVEPSDRFVLSSVGATRFRLSPDGSGVSHLYLAGDWTWNGFNCGCVEGTVVSGLLCSRAITGYPRRIIGERPFGIGLGT